MKKQIPIVKPKHVSSSTPDRRSAMLPLLFAFAGLLLVSFATATTQAQTLLSETTWGGNGSDVSEGVATAADGTSYVVGITDSFANDPFGNPALESFL
jgi:hypothetical protein